VFVGSVKGRIGRLGFQEEQHVQVRHPDLRRRVDLRDLPPEAWQAMIDAHDAFSKAVYDLGGSIAAVRR
jgi:hypothetical protein